MRPANVAGVRLAGGRFAPVWRAGAARRVWWGGGWRVWAPITALGAVVIAGSYYWPDAYLATARPYCEGITPDGCRLNWQMVDFEGGGGDWQCVQYCPRAGAAPPPRTVALVAPPAMAQGKACELSIFSEPNSNGTNATANTEQPRLGEIGWQNQIASVRVRPARGISSAIRSSPARRCGCRPASTAISARSGRSTAAASCACSRRGEGNAGRKRRRRATSQRVAPPASPNLSTRHCRA